MVSTSSPDVFGVTANLIIATAGAGILSLPFAVMKAGLVLGVAMSILFAALNAYTMRLLIRHAVYAEDYVDTYQGLKLSAPASEESNGPKAPLLPQPSHLLPVSRIPNSYFELINTQLGETAGVVANLSIYIGIVGALIGFLIIIAELTCPVFEAWTHSESIFAQRVVVIPIFVLFVAMPLSALANLHSLVLSSVLAVISVLFVVIVVVVRFGNSSSSFSQPQPKSWWSIFEAMPIILFAYGCPLQVVTSTYELHNEEGTDKHTTLKAMNASSLATICVCAGMYLAVGGWVALSIYII
jgi:amino acid permease